MLIVAHISESKIADTSERYNDDEVENEECQNVFDHLANDLDKGP